MAVKIETTSERFQLKYRSNGDNRTLSVPKSFEIKAKLQNKDVLVVEVTVDGSMEIVDLIRAEKA